MDRGEFEIGRQEDEDVGRQGGLGLEQVGVVGKLPAVEFAPVTGEQGGEVAALGGDFEGGAFELGQRDVGEAQIVEGAGDALGKREAGGKSAEIAVAEFAEELGGDDDAAERGDEGPGRGRRGGEGQGGDRVEMEVDAGRAGAGEGFKPLLADAAGGAEEPFFGERMLPTHAGEGGQQGVLAWRGGGKTVSASRHGARGYWRARIPGVRGSRRDGHVDRERRAAGTTGLAALQSSRLCWQGSWVIGSWHR